MKAFAFFGLWFFALATQCTTAGESRAAYEKFSNNFSRGLEDGNSALFLKTLSKDIKVLPEYDKSFLGLPKADKYFKSLADNFDIQRYRRRVLDVTRVGQRAVAIGTFELSIKQRKDTDYTSLQGTWLDVWDHSSASPIVITLAWNYDKHVPGIETFFRSHSTGGVHFAFQPTAALDGVASRELATFRLLNKALMQLRDPHSLAMQYASDAWNAPHNLPLVVGRKAIEDFFANYVAEWPTFEYLDTNSHDIYVYEKYVLAHNSYNLRWRSGDHSGIAMGKGVSLYRWNEDGALQKIRSISMHD